MKVGILGLGIIGSAWARNLHSDGLLAACWNRSPKPDFPELRATPAEVARAADLLIICLADPPAVSSVLEQLPLTSKHLVVQTSTIDPGSSRSFAARVKSTGAAYLESPFTGSKLAAAQRETVFFQGGDVKDMERAEPALSRISKVRFNLGAPERAAAMKLAQNILAANYAEALCEALAFARRSGVTDEAFFDALRPSVVWSGFAELKEPKLKAGDFSTQFSVKHMLKDMRLALSGGAKHLPLTQTVERCLERAAEHGWAEDDFISLIRNL